MGTALENRKRMRKKIIFNIIKNNNNLLSRNDLCKKSSYSMTAIAETVDELIRENMLLEIESSEQRLGRPPVLLSINPQSSYFVGLECSSYSVNIEVINAVDESVYTNSINLSHPSANDLLLAIKNILTTFSTHYSEMWMHTSCVTISLPGKLDIQNAIGISYASIPDWKMVDVRGYLHKYFSKKFVFMNNIDSMLIGYRFVNHVPEDSSTLFVMIRNGTGVRFFAKHNLLSNYGIVCELGHAKAYNSDRVCVCGKRGCYDAEITTSAIVNKMKEAISTQANELSQRFQPLVDEHEYILEFFNLVREGNSIAVEIFNECSFHIANLLTNVLLISNADTIVLSSEMCHIMPLFEQNIYYYLAQNEVPPLPEIDFVLPQNNFGAIGAASNAYRSIMSEVSGIY